MALRRALLEAAQSRAVAIQGSREDLIRHASDWQDDDRRSDSEWIRMSARPAVELSLDADDISLSTIADALLYVWGTLEARGVVDVAISVLPPIIVDLFAVHVAVPGLIDRISDPHRIRSAIEPAC